MIGIINSELSAYSILEKIRDKYPTCDIYLYPYVYENILDILPFFIEKKCSFLILPKKDKKKVEELYSDIYCFSLEDFFQNSVFDREDLLKAIREGNLLEVESILNQITVPVEDIIYLNYPELLFIRSLIEKRYPNSIVFSLDNLLCEMDTILVREKISLSGNGISNVFAEKK